MAEIAHLKTLKARIKDKHKPLLERMAFEVNQVTKSTPPKPVCVAAALAPHTPKGRAGLRIIEWSCSEYGALHDRDINAAQNILALGHERLAGGILALSGGEDVNEAVLQ
ncbi:hypothetical protein [uncultured Thiothrix sp.]|uniref:hypothetical protein n=1 Tax=uncultured Thiothrix sp. TaxID=223185 RepID=UPI0026315117|nr:hypothetical protein [uncultured Thiothrix sp.]